MVRNMLQLHETAEPPSRRNALHRAASVHAAGRTESVRSWSSGISRGVDHVHDFSGAHTGRNGEVELLNLRIIVYVYIYVYDLWCWRLLSTIHDLHNRLRLSFEWEVERRMSCGHCRDEFELVPWILRPSGVTLSFCGPRVRRALFRNQKPVGPPVRPLPKLKNDKYLGACGHFTKH